MSDKIFIRPTKFLDISQIKKINEASLQENYPKSYWDEKFHEGKTHSFVAVCLNQIIGYIFCSSNNIMSFAIIEQYRNKGIGKQLIHCCLNTFDIAVTLHVRTSNENAIKLYRSAGFVEIDTIIDYYSNPKENAYTMKCQPGKKFVEKRKLRIKK